MRSFAYGSIRRTLSLLVGMVFLPALAIVIYSGIELRNKAIENAKREMLFIARTMGEVQEEITNSTRQVLATLAQTKEVRSLDHALSSGLLQSVLDENPFYLNILAVDPSGEVRASGRSSYLANLADRSYFRRTLQRKSFLAGEYIVTRAGPKQPSLVFAFPALDAQGTVEFVMAAVINLESYRELFDVARFPANSFFSVNDRNGIRLFYYPPLEKINPVGSPIHPVAWQSARNAAAPGICIYTGDDGIRRIFAFTPVRMPNDPEPYAYVWAGIPESAVLAPANRILARNLSLMLLTMGLALAASWLVGEKTILKPLRRLVQTTRAFAAGDVSARTEVNAAPGELSELASAFDDMADALVEVQRRLRTIANYTYDWEYWMDPQGRPLWVSPSCESFTGYQASEFMADPSLFKRIVHEEDREAFAAQRGGFGHELQMDFRILHKSGHTVWLDHHCLPLTSPEGIPLGVRVSNRDITERKRVEQALLESEARFRSLVEGAPDAIFVQTDYRFAYVNEACLRLFGAVSPDQLLGSPVFDRFHPDYHDTVRDRIERLNTHKTAVPRKEQVYLRLDGSPVPVEASAVPLTFKGRDGALVFARDIADRKNAERRLVASEAELMAIYENVPIVMCLLDCDQRLVRLNRAALQFTARSESDLIGRRLGEMIGCPRLPEDPNARDRRAECSGCPLQQVVQDTIENGTTHSYVEMRLDMAWEGEIRKAWVIAGTARLSIEGQARILLCLADVTEHRRLEEQYLRAQRLESLGVLASGVAHDLNNVLSPLLLGGFVLRSALKDADSQATLAIMMDAVRRGADTVKQLLAFARGGEGEKRVMHPRPLLKEIGHLMRQTLPKSIQIYTDCAPNTESLLADASRLHQVLMNLCVNARDAMPHGGILSITAENVALDEQAGRLHPKAAPGPHVLLKVSDTGSGIAPEILDKIFDPFFTTKPQGEGTGLGLATCLGIVENHGGFILVESMPQKGAVFSLYLPSLPHAGDAEDLETDSAALNGHGETILIVDDEQAICRIVQKVLDRRGYRTLTAGAAVEALELFHKHRDSIRAVVTDLMMPFVDGTELVGRLRAFSPELRIVAFSGLTTQGRIEEVISAGANAFLHKPVNTTELLTVLHSLLDTGKGEHG